MRWWQKLTAMFEKHWPRGRKGGGQPWDPVRTWRGLKVLGVAALTVAVVVGYLPAQRALGQWLRQERSYTLATEHVRLVNAPPWMPAGFRARLQQLVAEQASGDPLDGEGLRRAVAALYACGWVEQVHSLRRVSAGLELRARYRVPAAFVREGPHYRLVDPLGRQLPGHYSEQQTARLNLPIILGAGPGPERDGEPWPGERLGAGLTLMNLLAGEAYVRQIRAVDLSDQDARGRLRLRLITEHGMVIWGLPAGQERGIEPVATLKRHWLAEVYRQTGSIDAGGAVVEVFGPAPFVRPTPRSAGTTQAPTAAGGRA